ncbi:MAG: diacylglycerol/lipid kinase family protein [Actinomycetota bacterium]
MRVRMTGVRLLLIVNVKAGSVTPWTVNVIEHALSSEFDVERAETKRQGHATHLAQGAAHEGVDLVVSMGGDGTVNEVVNGLAGTHVPLALIPGGGTNVLARSLGIPKDPVEATWHLLANRNNPPRRVPLGRAVDRYFTFACGMGFDGAIVRDVERRQGLKKGLGHPFFVWSGVRIFFGGVDRRHAPIRLRWGPNLEHGREDLFLAICQKTRPFTYFRNREMNICPEARLEKGIDLLAIDTFRASTILRVVGQAFRGAIDLRNPHVLYLHDQQQIEATADMLLPVQMDGEYIGDHKRVLFESVPDALSLLY